MPSLRFATYDVFTAQRFAGNPLAVVFGADGLSDEAMQAVAREFNLSETVFVQTPAQPAHTAAIRIFTPTLELPFAGHPTIGCAICLAEERFTDGPLDSLIMLEEKVGLVRCAVSRGRDEAPFAEFVAPRLPSEVGPAAEDALFAEALGLRAEEIGHTRHIPSIYTAGVPYAFVPVASLDALARARPQSGFDLSRLGARDLYVYARLPESSPHAFRARMFAPALGITEDPATGGAAAAFAGVVARFETPGDGANAFPIEQGVEMGRPSLIGLTIEMEGGALRETRISGGAVKVSEGVIFV